MKSRLTPAIAIALCLDSHAAPDASRVSQIRVLTFNSWHEWSKIDDGFAKAKAAIESADVDLVGLQESSPAAAQRMADALEWHRAGAGTGSVQILSRYPILKTFGSDHLPDDRFVGARVRVSEDPPLEVVFCNTHLDYEHYGPYAARVSGASSASVLAENAQSERVAQITAVLSAMEPWLAESDSVPVILTGDFNVPSHLDWTAGTAPSHGGVGPVLWPESKLVEQAGLRDSFRVAHPNPVAEPGNTWSTIHKDTEPQDRIDFIYFSGELLSVVDSQIFASPVEVTIGKWGTDEAPVRKNSWPSDHFAVLTTFSYAHRTARP